MKRKVVITFEVDPTEYEGAEDSDLGTLALVISMLRGEADLPSKFNISCGSITKPFEPLDLSKKVFRIQYREKAKTNWRYIRFVNAENEEEAKRVAETYGDVGSFEKVEEISPERIEQWESMRKHLS